MPAPPATRLGRRALVLGAAATGAGLTADLIAGAKPAEAANGNAVELGETNSATASTVVNTTAGTGLQGGISGSEAGASGVSGVDNTTGTTCHGIYGRSINGTGVYGQTSGPDGYGLHGVDAGNGGAVGIFGTSINGFGVYGLSNNLTGVQGATQAKGQSGVAGIDDSTAGGHGVYGKSTNGTGVYATSSKGAALEVNGPARFSRSGVATVPKGARSVEVSLAGVTTASLILATPQGRVAGVAVEGVVPDVSASSFTIYLTQAVSVSLKVAWFVIG